MTISPSKKIVSLTAIVPTVAAASLFSGAADASTLTIVDYGDTGPTANGPNGSTGFDLDTDGTDDFFLGVATRLPMIEKLDDDLSRLDQNLVPIDEVKPGKFEVGSISSTKALGQMGGVSSTRPRKMTKDELSVLFAQEFFEGDQVGASDKPFFFSAPLYIEDNLQSPLGFVGDSMYVGLSLTKFIDDGPIQTASTVIGDLEREEPKSEGDVFFGWAEIERGSLRLLRTGFQTVAGMAAPIPEPNPIPVPPALALLASGAAGLAALRRRKKAA